MKKLADITPVYEKDNRLDKENYRPISILTALPKIFERCLYDQIYKNVDNILLKYQTGYWIGDSSQNSLIVMF